MAAYLSGETAPDEALPADGRQKLRILLLDRSRLLADVLGRRLVLEDEVTDVRVASSAAEGLRLLCETTVDLVIATPALAGEVRAAPAEQTARRAAPIVILADDDDATLAPTVFRLRDIVGWVSRDRSSDDLMMAIRTWQRGDVCIPAQILSLLAEQHAQGEAPESAREKALSVLTEREIDILKLLEKGMGRAEIAATLHLSPNTVRTHIQRILRRLGVHSTLAALAIIRA